MRMRIGDGLASHEQLSALIGKIYDAALTPAAWQAVANEIIASLQGSAGHFFTPMHMPSAGGFSFTVNIPDTYVQQYAAKYHKYDLWSQAGFSKGLMTSGTVVSDEELVPRRTLTASRFYREFLKPSDTVRGCMSVVFGTDSSDMRTTCMSVYRSQQAKPFEAATKRLAQLLNPHISRSLGITFRLQDAQFAIATTHAALDRIQSGIVLLDASGAVTFANRAAADIFNEGKVLSLRRSVDGRDRIVGPNAGITAEIDLFIASALGQHPLEVDHFIKKMPIPRAYGKPPLLLNVSALPFENNFNKGSARSGAILFITDAERSLTVDSVMMAKLFQLTDAEIALVSAMCSGNTLAEVAELRKVSIETVRSQLKSVFAKTQTSRQAELLRLVLGLSSTQQRQ